MYRRDFLLLKTRRADGKRVVELSCERLFMRCLDAQAAFGGNDADRALDDSGGEPPRSVDMPTVDQLFRDLAADLHDADVLHLVDTRWLASEPLKQRLGDLVAAFRARGGIVQM